MKRHEIHLDVRADTDEGLEQVAERVGQALNCAFAEGEFQDWYAQVANVFGLALVLVAANGVGGKKVAKLMGEVDEEDVLHSSDGSDQVEYDRVDISSYVVDLLTIRTGLRWYRPTAEDYAAEREARSGFDNWLGGLHDD